MDISTAWALLVELIGVAAIIVPLIASILKKIKANAELQEKIATGTKCQLRSEMLRIYYHHRESKKIRQFEFENFIKLYEAYKALGGNSFVDRISEEVNEWEIVT